MNHHFSHRVRPLPKPLGPVVVPDLVVLRARRDAWRNAAPERRGFREEIQPHFARVTLIENGDVVAESEALSEHAALANALQAVLL